MSFLSDYFIDLYYYSEYEDHIDGVHPVVQYVLGDCDLPRANSRIVLIVS
jgi:hypothetical protein